MKLEKAAQANTAVRRLSGHSKNLHKLDRRTEKLPGHVFRRRRSKHHWVSHKLASSQEESLVVEPPHLSQDYFQCSTIPGQNPKSRFKWLRPSLYQLHAQNLLRQKMKQRLKMGYGRTHKYAGFNTEKSLWQQSQALKARQYRFKGNMIHIGGVLYKSSSRKLIKARRTSTSKTELTFATSQANRRQSLKNNDWRQQKMKLILLRGAHFNIDTRRRKLSRAVLSSSTGPSASDSGLLSLKVGDEKTRIAASRAVYRSIAIATAKFKKNNTKSRTLKQHCIFFGRFGKCFRGDDCPYIHDAAKVAVCTRFLRGKCEDVNCPFSHKASVNKMPVCLFYLRGSCSRDGCPYLHVKVNPDAPVCRDFHNGFCSLGDKCKKLHSFVCPSFADTGTCSRGSDCPMLHRISRKEQTTRRQLLKQSEPVKKRRLANSQASSNTAESLLELVQPMAVAINTAPLTSQPSFISLLSTDNNPQTPAADIRSQVSSDNKELRSGEQEVSARIMPVFLTQQISKSTPHKSGLDVCEPHVTAQEKIVQSEKVTLPPDASSFDTANDEQVKTGYQPPVQSCPAPSQPGVPIKIIPSFLSQNKSIEAVLAKNVVVQSGEKNSINL
ncbi:unnamed protein product [Lymnaea stagnalis]|uniref:Zinc finger CCCH domain-containing protein 3 n=1 Tax=Lymnaea stagnalis TaxID=6523 RepID=A0AAV2HWC6_LYMST